MLVHKDNNDQQVVSQFGKKRSFKPSRRDSLHFRSHDDKSNCKPSLVMSNEVLCRVQIEAFN